MGLLDGKVAVVFGVANKRSIAWGVTKALHDAGATVAMNFLNEQIERRVIPLAEEIGCDFVEECDVSSDESIDKFFEKLGAKYDKIDILVHSVAFAPRDDLGGRFVDISREGFKIALDISAYSLIALSNRAVPMMTDGGSIMCMTYYAAEKFIPDYNVMAVAKSALETITLYLAKDLGPQRIRVNAISAGPIKSLAAAGIPGFRNLLRRFELVAPLAEPVTIERIGQTAVYLGSDMSVIMTGEVLHVDSGFNILGLTVTDDEIAGIHEQEQGEQNNSE